MSGDTILSWGLCLLDCVYETPEPSCLEPPSVPKFGYRNSSGHILKQNYVASWFNLMFMNDSDGTPNHDQFKVSRNLRSKLYQPWIPYDENVKSESNLEFIAESQDAHFNDVYEIIPERGTVNYSCPLGWVFEDTKNISQHAVCSNWTWDIQFNVSKACVPVVCPEEEVPKFHKDSAVGTNNVQIMKKASPEKWNGWRHNLTYTCPQGYVLDIPGNDMEQTDPIPEEEDTRSFTVQCGDNAVWTPRLLHGGTAMPKCIPINCTEAPYKPRMNDLGMYSWTGVDGIDARPYATEITYFCPRKGWGYPSDGLNTTTIRCNMDGSWSNLCNIEMCMKLPCPEQPPPATKGEGAERVYGPEVTKYRCENGYMFKGGQFPYLEMECLNKRWMPARLPNWLPRKCSAEIAKAFMGMTVFWRRDRNPVTGFLKAERRSSLGDTIFYHCPMDKITMKDEMVQEVTCIWHRQTDLMLWWPPNLHTCSRKFRDFS